MKLFFSIVLIQFSLLAFSSEKGILIPEVTLVSSEKSESLISNESLFIFQFKGFIAVSYTHLTLPTNREV